MKKLLFILLFCAVQAFLFSCTADEDTSANSATATETGGQHGIPPPQPPTVP